MGLSAKIDAQIPFELTGVGPLGGETRRRFDGWGVQALDGGTGNNQVDRMYEATITLAASATQDIDLNGTVLLDALGGPASFVKVKAIAVRARAANTNNVVIGNAATNGFVGPFGAITHTVALPPGGMFVVSAPLAGWTVTPATGDLLRVANSGAGTSVTLDIVIVGTSV